MGEVEKDEVEEEAEVEEEEVVEEEVVVRPAQSGCLLNRDGNWRQQGHLKLVVPAKTLCHPGF